MVIPVYFGKVGLEMRLVILIQKFGYLVVYNFAQFGYMFGKIKLRNATVLPSPAAISVPELQRVLSRLGT
jgi:hypothetical protein